MAAGGALSRRRLRSLAERQWPLSCTPGAYTPKAGAGGAPGGECGCGIVAPAGPGRSWGAARGQTFLPLPGLCLWLPACLAPCQGGRGHESPSR